MKCLFGQTLFTDKPNNHRWVKIETDGKTIPRIGLSKQKFHKQESFVNVWCQAVRKCFFCSHQEKGNACWRLRSGWYLFTWPPTHMLRQSSFQEREIIGCSKPETACHIREIRPEHCSIPGERYYCNIKAPQQTFSFFPKRKKPYINGAWVNSTADEPNIISALAQLMLSYGRAKKKGSSQGYLCVFPLLRGWWRKKRGM